MKMKLLEKFLDHGLFKGIQRSIVYHLSDRPSHYVHVDKPKTIQDRRQIQYDEWCKAKKVYNGSYLPKNDETLLRKGWIDITPPAAKENKPDQAFYQRKSSGQIVRHEDETEVQYDHYHWENRFSLADKSKKDTFPYIDRYGKPIKRRKNGSHLKYLDLDYRKKK